MTHLTVSLFDARERDTRVVGWPLITCLMEENDTINVNWQPVIEFKLQFEVGRWRDKRIFCKRDSSDRPAEFCRRRKVANLLDLVPNIPREYSQLAAEKWIHVTQRSKSYLEHFEKSYSAIPHDTNGFSAQVRTPRLVKWVQPFSGDAGHLVAGSATFGRWIRFCVLPTLWWMIWNKPVQDKLDCDELLRSRLSRSSELAAPWRWFPLFADIRMICTGHRQVKAIFRPPCHWLMISMVIT